MENLVQVVLPAPDLAVLRGGEVREDAMGAEHQEQGLIGARPVGAAGEAVERFRRAAARPRQVPVLVAGRRQGVDDEAAADGDPGGDRRLEERAGGEQRRHVDRRDQEPDLEHGRERVLVATAAAAGEHGAERHDLAADQARRAPVGAGHRAAVHGRRHRPGRAGGARIDKCARPLPRHQVRQRGAAGKRADAQLAPGGGEAMGPEIGCDGRPIVDPRAFGATASLHEGVVVRPTASLHEGGHGPAAIGRYNHR